MLLVLFSVVLFSLCECFLLNSTIFSSGGGGTALTDKHYITVVDMITEEKQARHQLEQYVLQLSKEISSNHQQNSNSKNYSDQSHDVLQLKNDTLGLKQALIVLEGKYNQLLTANNKIVRENVQLQNIVNRLQSQCNTCRNETNEFKNRLNVWEKSTTALKISNVTEFQSKMKVAESKISSLISSNNARSQDFLALLNQINKRSNKVDGEISMLNSTTVTESKANTVVLGKIHMDLNQAMKEISELQFYVNQTVAVSSCKKTDESLSGNTVIKFDLIKSIYGISNVDSFKSSGIFKCEIAGLYLITATIMSTSSYAEFSIHVNGQRFERILFQIPSPGSTDYQTGTGNLAIHLSVGDTVMVKTDTTMTVFGENMLSCITIIKLK